MSVAKDLHAIQANIRTLLADALGVQAAEVDDHRTFFELGLTSRIGVSWMGRVNQVYGLMIPAVRVFAYPTLEKMAGLIRQELDEQAQTGGAAQGRARFGARSKPTAPVVAPPPVTAALTTQETPQRRSFSSFRGKPVAAKTVPVPANAPVSRRAEGAGIDQPSSHGQAIAVIGLSGRFPQARTARRFWRMIVEGRDCITRVERDYWRMDAFYSPERQAGKTYSQWLGALEDVDRFDPLFFNISPADADHMDPQQRLFLQEAWSSLEDAGYRPETLAGGRCGVFVGCGTYGQSQNGGSLTAAGFLGGSPSILAARIAYHLDLRGPCLTIDTACSASLAAIAQACDSLALGVSDLALAGGVSVLADPSIHIMASQAGMLSPDGRCLSFDQRANGFVPAEGVGVVVLKRLTDALRDGDHIYGTVIGWGLNQDGKTNGITAPSQASQSELQQSVFNRFAIDPRTVGLVEAHGSGTKLGDPIEVEALVGAFRRFTEDVGFCALGSVKSNMGHMLAAAGVGGFFKALMALEHKILPPSIHFETLNEHIRLDDTPFYVNTETRAWPADSDAPRRALVSSFGFSGTNVCVVLQEHVVKPSKRPTRGTPDAHVIVLSAVDEERLRASALQLAEFAAEVVAAEGVAPRLEEAAYTLQTGRMAMPERLAIVVRSWPELQDRLQAFARDGSTQAGGGVFHGRCAAADDDLATEDELASRVQGWIEAGALESLARLWVRRGGFDWNALWTRHEATPPQRVSLPTYPFARRPCAMPIFQPPGSPSASPVLSPLVHRNVSTFEHLSFRSEFDGGEFYFIDHVIAGRKTLPGVAYIEIAGAAGFLSAGEPVAGLKNVVWGQPFLASDVGAALEIRLKRKNGRARFEIHNVSAATSLLCAQGELLFASAGEIPGQPIDLTSRLAGAVRFEERAGCYERFRAQGFAYGPAFRNVKALYGSGRDIIARIERGDMTSADSARPAAAGLELRYRITDGFVLHPGLLDSAFQPCLRFCESHDPQRAYIPYALGEIRIFDGLPERFYSIATLQEIDDESARFAIQIVDDDGRALVRIEDLTLRPVKLADAAPEKRRTDVHLYRMAWSAAPTPISAGVAEEGARLLFLPAGASRQGVAREQDVVVHPGRGFRVLDDRTYEIAPASEADHQRLWHTLEPIGRSLTVAHFWADADQSAPGADPLTRLADQVARNFESLSHIARRLVSSGDPRGSRLLHFHPQGASVPTPAAMAVGGFLRSLAAEHPGLVVRSIGHDGLGAGALLEQETAIPYSAGEAIEARYKNGRREVFTPQAVNTAADAGSKALRDSGVYLISGGAGGLGLMLAEFLIRRCKAHVVLTGRSVPDRRIENALARLNEPSAGGSAIYRKADVARLEEAQALVDAVKAQFHRLNGVFHCAGFMDNAALIDKNPAQSARIIASKVFGAVALDEAARDEALDLFVVYSSISAVMRFGGQTDYAYANRFLDGFAARRDAQAQAGLRQGRSLSLGWTLWRDGGMRLDEQLVRHLERSKGLTPLDRDAGLAALETALTIPADHLIIVRGDARRIEAAWEDHSASAVRPPKPAASAADGLASGSVTERALAELAELLKLRPSDIDPDQNLMAYGLDSISAMMLINKINDAFEISAQPAALLRHPTLNAFVAHIMAEHQPSIREEEDARPAPDDSLARIVASPGPEFIVLPVSNARSSAPERANGVNGAEYPDPYLGPVAEPAAMQADGPTRWPMTRGQQALWFIHSLDETSSAYHIALTFRLLSPLDRTALEQSYEAILQRHPALRARFHQEAGQPVQRIEREARSDLRFIEATGRSSEDVREAMKAAHREPFDLERDSLSRLRVFVVSERESVFLWTVHHLVSDAWSQWLLLDELLAEYSARRRGESAGLPELARTFGDFVHEEEVFLASEAGRRQQSFWRQRLIGEPPVLNLPADYPRPPTLTFNGASAAIQCGGALSESIRRFARAQGVTVFTVLLAAYQCLLCRSSGDRRVWIGSPTSGRFDQRDAPVVGCFINSVVLTADLDSNPTFSDLLQQQQQVVADALENQRIPLSSVVQSLNPCRSGGRTPLFQAEFVFQKAHQDKDLIRLLSPREGARVERHGLQLASEPFAQQEGQFDIGLEMMEIDDQFAGALKYNADLFAAASMEDMRDRFLVLLANCVEHAGTPVWDIPMTARRSADEAAHLRGPRLPKATLSVGQLFERQAARRGGCEAIRDGSRAWTYAELNERANRLARHLQASGLTRGRRIALCMRRSVDLAAALLATGKAGAAYIPMDPAFPAQRLQHMLDDARPALVLVDSAADLPSGLELRGATLIDLQAQAEAIVRQPAGDPAWAGEMGDVAYVIYTSGSTGRPKGVQISHGSLSNFLHSMSRVPGLSTRDRLLAVTTVSFDIAALELFLPLTTGAAVTLASREQAMDALALQRLLEDRDISVMQATPTTWRMLIDSGWPGKQDLTVLCGGEPMPRSLARDLLDRCERVWNLYGPTETTIWSCVARVDGQGEHAIEPIGEPIGNTNVHILDAAQNPAPIGVAGELCIGGDGVAVGYLNRPELNAEKFIQTAFGRLYRTGDRARLNADGQLEFLGREDHQLKVRGFRVEAGEIEDVIRSHERVSDCVVTLWKRPAEGNAEEGVLVAYLVTRERGPIDAKLKAELRRRLREALPAYMTPSLFVGLDAFPLTPNSKVDRKALPPPDAVEPTGDVRQTPPEADDHALIVSIWSEVLQLDEVGDDSHFFDAGGTSFTATRLIYRIREALAIAPPVSLLFDHPTLAAFSVQVRRLLPQTASPAAPPGRATDVKGDFPTDAALLDMLAQVRGGQLSVDQASRLMGFQ